MRLADYTISVLAKYGIDTAFMVTGGMAMHLNDALALEQRIKKVCCHHEQACALAAEAYANVSGRPALVQVTAGPGAINAMTGVYGAYVDGTPMVVITGQPKRELTKANYRLENTRQVGEQESDAIIMARSITKYASAVLEPSRIRYELEKALHIATEGRPGPVWLEIPVDVQAALIEPEQLQSFIPGEVPPPDLRLITEGVLKKLNSAARPLLVIGPGLRRSKADKDFLRLAEKLQYPIVCAGTLDVITGTHPLYAGAMGALGNRAGNIAIQNADMIVFLGVTMHASFTTYNWKAMGKNAFKVVVECDPGELERPQFIGNQTILVSPLDFIKAMCATVDANKLEKRDAWLSFCKERLRLMPPVMPHMRNVTLDGRINAYWFTEELFKLLAHDIVVPGNATAGITAQQAGILRPGQRLIANFGSGPMGFALPAAVGAAMAAEKKQRVICLDGDGSFMMNMQELATIAHKNLPIIIFIYNNGGYSSIKQSQQNFFEARIGFSSENGLSFPNFTQLAKAFGIPSTTLSGQGFKEELAEIMEARGPILVEVLLDKEQTFEPKISSKKLSDGRIISLPPEDMAPFLPREELQSHLLFPLDNQDNY